jgi:methyl-accepting chemotaxis protein
MVKCSRLIAGKTLTQAASALWVTTALEELSSSVKALASTANLKRPVTRTRRVSPPARLAGLATHTKERCK